MHPQAEVREKDVSSFDPRALFDEAVAVAAAARAAGGGEGVFELEDDTLDALHRAVDARADIAAEIMGPARDKILAAAASGRRAVDLFRFNGNDTRRDISVLFLMRGARPGSRVTSSLDALIAPLFPELTAALAPFVISHDWDSATAGNRIVASWRPESGSLPTAPA